MQHIPPWLIYLLLSLPLTSYQSLRSFIKLPFLTLLLLLVCYGVLVVCGLSLCWWCGWWCIDIDAAYTYNGSSTPHPLYYLH